MFIKMLILCYLIIIIQIIFVHVSAIDVAPAVQSIKFFEEPSDTYVTKSIPATLKCKIENARTGFFKCNDEWSQEQTTSKTVQIGNKQILTIEQDITRSQLEEHRKSSSSEYWCICQGWSFSGETIISKKAFVKLAFLSQNFVWEPMTTTGLIGKSVEIRCLPPDGNPRPNVYWLKNDIAIDKSNKRIFVSHEGSLLINDVRAVDNGNYTCVAENIAGKRVSDAAQLIVTENKGWSEYSNWTECGSLSQITCGEGIQKRYRTCFNPPTINNAIGCEGFPMQVITCYVPCEKPSEQETNSLFYWSDWSDWLIECSNMCKKIRKRTCLNNLLKPPQNQDHSILISKLTQCTGSDTDIVNCTENTCHDKNKDLDNTTKIRSQLFDSNSKRYLLASGAAAVVLVLIIVIILLTSKCKFCKRFVTQKKYKPSPSNDHHPIYYSVQPDFTQDTYMDVCTLLPTTNSHIGLDMKSNNINSSCTTSSTSTTDDHKQSSSSSPTDSLKFVSPSVKINKNYNNKANEYEILKLIQNQNNFQNNFTKLDNWNRINYENCDLYAFNVFNVGGFLEIPKYSLNALISDDTISNEIQIGVDRTTGDFFNLSDGQTLLSAVHVIKCDNESLFKKPIILSIEHSAQSVENDWQTTVIYKSVTGNSFQEINEDVDYSLYSHVISNRCYIITEKTGYYALIGQQKTEKIKCIKHMKYAIVINSFTIRVLLIQNTRAALESANEEMQKLNGKIIQMPKLFELKYEKKSNEHINLEITINIKENNKLVNLNAICKKVQYHDLWNMKKDFYEIEIPLLINNSQLISTHQQQQTHNNLHIKTSFKYKNEFLFSFSTNEMIESRYTTQQEFYSSVSVNPVFKPLKINALLDEYFCKYFKMTTLKKDDWRLFASLLNCDRNVNYFSNKTNSFELIIGLLFMINLNQNDNITVNLTLNG